MTDYEQCMLCPRRCGADRAAGNTGFCGMTAQPYAARAALHYWEEPVISGEYGTGAVFFSGCTLQCAFCQNSEISVGRQGKPLEATRLREIFDELLAQGAQSLSLVTGTQFLPDILQALEQKPPVPVVWNSGGYERTQTLARLDGKIDVYLPDMKYSDHALAAKLSGASDYVETAKAAILEMYRQTGPYQIENGLLRRGVLIRHLVLPGQIDNSLGVIDWIADTFAPHSVLVSLMSQYVPMGRAKQMPPFDRRVTQLEYDAVLSWMELRGLEDGFTQDFSAASVEYVPDFSGVGI